MVALSKRKVRVLMALLVELNDAKSRFLTVQRSEVSLFELVF